MRLLNVLFNPSKEAKSLVQFAEVVCEGPRHKNRLEENVQVKMQSLNLFTNTPPMQWVLAGP